MTRSLPQSVAAEVRAEMARQNVSQRDLAQQLGRSQAYLGRRLTCEVPLDIADLEAIGRCLGVSVLHFIPVPAGAA